MNKTDDRRTFSRTDAVKPVSYEPSGIKGKPGSLWANTINLSKGGMCVLTRKPEKPGSVLRVNLPLTSTEVSVPCLAEVRWVAAKTVEGRYRVGLRFLG